MVHDAVLVVDDFAPEGAAADVAAAHRAAAYGIRSQGNLAGRARLTREAVLRPARVPSALRVCTGEDRPRGQSILARLLVLELDEPVVGSQAFTACQHAAAAGLFAQALAGYVRYLAPRYGEHRRAYRSKHQQLRRELQQAAGHRRTADTLAHLTLGFRAFLDFAFKEGALSEGEMRQLDEQARAALDDAARAQAVHVVQADPVARYVRLVIEAISSGAAHVAGSSGGPPDNAGAWGWREHTVAPSAAGLREWRPQGKCIGYVEGEDLHLLPVVTYAVVDNLCRDTGESLGVSERTLRRRLAERGRLASTDPQRETYAVQRTLGGRRQTVLHLRLTRGSLSMGEEPEQPERDAREDD